jgi:lysophospholipase L1-like esterase
MRFGALRPLILAAACLAAACGGQTATGPTHTAPPAGPQITCPTAPSPVESLDGAGQVVSFAAAAVIDGEPPLTTSCLPVSGSTFPVGTTTVTCMTKDALARAATCSFPVVVLAPPKLTVTSFLAFGDSMTAGDDGRNAVTDPSGLAHVFVLLPPGEAYPGVLQVSLHARYKQQSIAVDNQGSRGESLIAGLSMDCQGGPPEQSDAFMRYLTYASSHQYGALLLMEGANDVNLVPGDSCVLPKAFGVIKRMVDDAKSRGLAVVLATIPPSIPPGCCNRAVGHDVVPVYDAMLRALASDEHIPLADVYTAFGSDAPSLLGADGFHPNVSGYQRIADTFFTAIKNALETRSATAATTRTR